MPKPLRVGDVGTAIRPRVLDNGQPVDGTSATKVLKLKKPDGTVIEKTLTMLSPSSQGRYQYVIESGVLDAPGPWQGQVYLEFSASEKWHSTIFPLQVEANLS